MPTGQSDEDNYSTETPVPDSLNCVRLTVVGNQDSPIEDISVQKKSVWTWYVFSRGKYMPLHMTVMHSSHINTSTFVKTFITYTFVM